MTSQNKIISASQSRCCLSALSAALLAAGLCSPMLHAAPSGGEVRAGDVRIERVGALTRIDQTSARAIIDWRGFDVGAAEQVRFNQPSPQAATLNRVTGNQQSRVDGSISANGQVFLVNQHGVIFGNGAKVEASIPRSASISATTDRTFCAVIRVICSTAPYSSKRLTSTLSLRGTPSL